MSHATRKPVSGLLTRLDTNQPAQLQKEASHEIANIETRDIILSRQRTIKALIRLRECAG